MEWIYFLEHKNDVKIALQQFLIDVNQHSFSVGSFTIPRASAREKGLDLEGIIGTLNEKGLSQKVKLFYSDNAKEHIDSELQQLLFDLLIDQRFSVVESQHQNGLAETGAAGPSCVPFAMTLISA